MLARCTVCVWGGGDVKATVQGCDGWKRRRTAALKPLEAEAVAGNDPPQTHIPAAPLRCRRQYPPTHTHSHT